MSELKENWPSRGPTISVVMACYKKGDLLTDAVDSIIAHNTTNVPLEIIIVDDKSPDQETQDALTHVERKYPGVVKVVRLDENSGAPARPRNIGLDMARGQYVTIMDPDDLMNNDPKLLSQHGSYYKRAIDVLSSDSSAALVVTDMEFFGDFDGLQSETGFPHPTDKTAITLHTIPAPIVFRRENAPRYDESMTSLEDGIFGLAVLENSMPNTRVAYLRGEPYYLYRQAEDSDAHVSRRQKDYPKYYRKVFETAPKHCERILPGISKLEDPGAYLYELARTQGYHIYRREPEDVEYLFELLSFDPEQIHWCANVYAKKRGLHPQDALQALTSRMEGGQTREYDIA